MSRIPDTDPVRIGILTVSDRAFRGVYADQGGPAIESWLAETLTSAWLALKSLVPDEERLIADTLRRLADVERCALILTTGGTGPAPRDVTPEATQAVCERLLPGFGEEMRRASLNDVPTAILSRQLAGTRGATLIINLPGKPSAIKTCLDAVFAAVPYGLDLIGAGRIETDPARIRAFRPAA